ncbi:MAG: hypothetical protein K6U87_06910 [Firmicutes bacterium]|nr:hypothetical protein [Bacillota bacterium]
MAIAADEAAVTLAEAAERLPEFRAARGGWARWRAGEPLTVAEARRYGRRWRWWALWERVWDRWVAQGQGASLTRFAEAAQAFWRGLEAVLDDPAPYDPAIELEWERILARGPAALAGWPDAVARTWAAMAAQAPEPDVAPAAVREVDAPRPARGEAPAGGSRAGAAPAAGGAPPQGPRPAVPTPAEVRPEPAVIPLRAGAHPYPPRLTAWRDALRAQGMSHSHSDKHRQWIWEAALRLGVPVEQVGPDTPGLPPAVRRMAARWQAFLRDEQGG